MKSSKNSTKEKMIAKKMLSLKKENLKLTT